MINKTPFIITLIAMGLRPSQAKLSALSAMRFFRDGETFEDACYHAFTLIYWR